MVEESLPGEAANKGWDRASIVFWSRKPYRPRMRREDFVLPTHLAGLRLLLSCLAPAACLTAFLVWAPLFFVTIFTGLSMTAFVTTLGCAFVVATWVLYIWVARASER